jgi:hypothetical protein
MSTAYVHIGTHKTGSRALQEFFAVNRPLLEAANFHYPDFSSFASHYLAWGLGFGNWVPTGRTREELLEIAMNELRTATAQAVRDGKTVLISSEIFSTFSLKDPGIVGRFKDVLTEIGLTDIRLICYCRRQDLFVESMYSELIKNGHPREFEDVANIWYLNYQKLLGFYADAFGADCITVRPFEKGQFRDNDLFADFLPLIGLERTDEWGQPSEDTCNVSFDPDITELLRLYDLRKFPASGGYESLSWVKKILMETFDRDTLERQRQDPPMLSPAQRLEVLEKYDASNQAVAREFADIEDGQLFQSPWPNPDEPWEAYPGLRVEKIAPLLMHIIVKQQQEIEELSDRLTAGDDLARFLSARREICCWDASELRKHIASFSADHLNEPVVENGTLVLESTSFDPSLFLAPFAVEAGNIYVVRLSFHASMDTRLQLFFTTTDQPEFTETNSRSVSLTAGWHEVAWVLPEGFAGKLRIDPADGAGRFGLREFALRSMW